MYSPPVLSVVCVDLHQVSAASFTGLCLDPMKLLLSPFSCSIDLQRPWIPNKEVSTQRKLPSHSFHILCDSHFTLDFQLLKPADASLILNCENLTSFTWLRRVTTESRTLSLIPVVESVWPRHEIERLSL